MLTEVLDRIHGSGATSEPADAVAANLARGDLQEAASFHLAALLEASNVVVHGRALSVAGNLVRLVRDEERSAAIWYTDVAVGFGVIGVEVTRRDGPNRLSDLLSLLQFSRDHSDTLVYLPSEMRDARLKSLAKEFGAGERFVRFLVAHYPQLSREIAA